MPKKIYVVRKGRKTGFFNTWAECQKQVTGYSGAEYKSFTKQEDAKAYLSGGVAENTKKFSDDEIIEAYVDGSYEQSLKTYGSGAILLYQGQEITLQKSGQDPELVDMRNVAGEIIAAQMAMEFAIDHNIPHLKLYHDYEGIAKWCTKAWKANKEGTKAYAAYYDSIKKDLVVTFIKVKAHAGDKYNEIADQLAKEAISKSV